MESCYAIRDVGDFVSDVARSVRGLLPAHIVSLPIIDLRQMRLASMQWTPSDMPVSEAFSGSYRLYCHQDPLFMRYLETFDTGTMVNSDLISRQEWHRLPVYAECYRPLEMEDLACSVLRADSDFVTFIGMGKQSLFDERDRLLMRMIFPHLRAVYRRLLPASSRGAGPGVIRRFSVSASIGGRILWASPEAYRFLLVHSLLSSSGDSMLSGEIAGYIRRVSELFETGGVLSSPVPCLDLSSEGRLVEVVCLPDSRIEAFTLAFRVSDGHDFHAIMLGSGLTRRESELLRLVYQGRTNDEIGGMLGITRQTVRRHLENIFIKLGVETRTAAANAAFERILSYYSDRD